jgi:hypothetical protein
MGDRLLVALRRRRLVDVALSLCVGLIVSAAVQAQEWPALATAIFGLSTATALLVRRRAPLLALVVSCAGVDVAAAAATYLSAVAMLGVLASAIR